VAAVKRAICRDPCTAYAFVSPSGGLKLGVHVPVVGDPAGYTHAWHTVSAAYERRYGVSWDPSGKDISRLCFVSYDPDLYWNPNAMCLHVPLSRAPTPKPAPTQRWPAPSTDHNPRDYGERALRTATEMIQSAKLGTRHHTRLKAARLLGGYVAGGLLTAEHAYGALAAALVGHTESRACPQND
jgi:VirE N-terminal domain